MNRPSGLSNGPALPILLEKMSSIYLVEGKMGRCNQELNQISQGLDHLLTAPGRLVLATGPELIGIIFFVQQKIKDVSTLTNLNAYIH